MLLISSNQEDCGISQGKLGSCISDLPLSQLNVVYKHQVWKTLLDAEINSIISYMFE